MSPFPLDCTYVSLVWGYSPNQDSWPIIFRDQSIGDDNKKGERNEMEILFCPISRMYILDVFSSLLPISHVKYSDLALSFL